MGELFGRPRPDKPLEWTGERLTTAATGQVEVEHLHRYLLARHLTRGLDVLDIASGEGYGSAFLAQTSRSVVGVETDPVSVGHARSSYVFENLRFVEGSAQSIPLDDHSVDCVVSFETLEHFYDQEQFLAEIRRVLRPGGKLIVSSPDRDIYSQQGRPSNPYHVRELTRIEFEKLLRTNFEHVALMGQRPIVGSAIVRQNGGDGPLDIMSFDHLDGDRFEASAGFDRPLYYIAIASDIPLTPLVESFYFERATIDSVMVVLPSLHLAHERLQEAFGQQEAVMADKNRQIDSLTVEVEQQGSAIAEKNRHIDSLAAEVEQQGSAIAEKNRHIDSLAAEVEQQGSAIAEKNRHIDSLAAEVEQQGSAIAEKNRHIDSLAAEIEQQGSAIAEKNGHIDSLAAEVRGLKAKLVRIKRRVPGWNGYFAASHSWKEYKKNHIEMEDALKVIEESGLRFFFILHPLYEVLKHHRVLRRIRCKTYSVRILNWARRFGIQDRNGSGETALEKIWFTPTEGTPDVSVIIPTYGQVTHTLNCLASITGNLPRRSLEVIVVEDASKDPRIEEIRRVPGITFIENQENLGFLQSCNLAAWQARARYLYFLNNDTIVESRAIDALVDFAERTPDAGIVGSRLVYPNGCQSEAGGIIWDDASPWNYGRQDDPAKPQYQCVREVDYVSGASMLVPRSVWEELKGFDEVFTPAYYEDTDLAFRVRAIGKKVYFQPLSVVCHIESVSYGREISDYLAINRQTMLKRWGELLSKEHFPNGQHLLRARDRAKHRPVILIVDHYVPEPDRDAGSRSIFEFIRSLKITGWIVKFWPHNLRYDSAYVQPLQQLGVEVLYAPYETSHVDWLVRNGADIDYVLLSRPEVSIHYIDDIRRFTNVPILYYGVDVHFARLRLEAAVRSDGGIAQTADEMERIERDIWRRVDAVLYASQEEADTVRRIEPEVAACLAPIYCFDTFQARAEATVTSKIIFVAGFAHPPNVDAAIWFVKEILPLIKRRRPEVCLSLIGSAPTDDVRRLAGSCIEVTEWVSADELAARYADARVAVVPLRFGAGVKLKVIEALVEGVPLVTTPVGAQGLIGIEDVVPVTEDARAFSEHVIRQLESTDEEWLQQSLKQLSYARKNFSRQNQIDSLLTALGDAKRVYESSWRQTERGHQAGI